MAGDLDPLGRGEGLENLLAAAGGEGFQLQQLLAHVHLRIAGQLTDLLDLILQLYQRFLEIEQGATDHGGRTEGRGGETGGGAQAAGTAVATAAGLCSSIALKPWRSEAAPIWSIRSSRI